MIMNTGGTMGNLLLQSQLANWPFPTYLAASRLVSEKYNGYDWFH